MRPRGRKQPKPKSGHPKLMTKEIVDGCACSNQVLVLLLSLLLECHSNSQSDGLDILMHGQGHHASSRTIGSGEACPARVASQYHAPR